MSLLVDCLAKNESANMQAAYVGRLDQSEAEEEAGRSDDRKGGLTMFRPQLEQLQ